MAEGFFWGQDPNINEELRRRIALQMLSSGKGRGFPKTLGEGLSAIGDAIGDRGIMSRLAAEEAASEKAGSDAVSRLGGPIAYARPDDVTETPAAPAAPAAKSEPPTPLFTAPEQPASMLRPELPTTLGGASAGGVGPESMYTSPKPLGMPPPAAPAQAQDDRWPQQSAALAGIESGGRKNPYATVGAVTKSGDRAYGKYQIMGANIPEWTKAALGRPLTVEQFLADPDAQEQTAKNRFQNYASKYGDEGAARAWFAGEGGMKNLNATDVHGRLNVGTYGQDFMRRMGSPQASPRDAVAAQLVAQGQDPAEPPPGQQATLGSSPILPQGMSAAPPSAPIRAMPQPPVRVAQAGPPQAGYVPTLGPAPTPPPVTTPTLQRIQQEIMQAPPATRPAVARALAPYIQQEQAKLAQQGVIYQDQLKRHHEREKMVEEARISAPERIQKAAKHPAELRKIEAEAKDLEAKANAGRIPTTRRLNDTDLQFDDATRTWTMPPTAPGVTTSAPELNESQSKLVQNYQKGRRALYNMGAGDALHSWTDWYGSGVPVFGNLLSSKEFQTQYQAADVFTNLVLRGETGAGALASEVASTIRRFIPRPGSSPELIEQMRREREAILEGIRDSLGNKKRVLDPFDARFADEVKSVTAARAKASAEGKPSSERDVVKDLPPVVISSKEEKDALPRGRLYRLATDPPDVVREKKKHE